MEKTESEQMKRFKEAAKQVGAETSDNALDNIMGKLDLKRKPEADEEEKSKKG